MSLPAVVPSFLRKLFILLVLFVPAKFAEAQVTITTASPLPPATNLRGYSQSISATGGDGDYLWTEVKPATGTDPSCPGPLTGLPPGLSVSASGENDNASVGFEPSVAGTFAFCVQADDNAGAVTRKQFQLRVNAEPVIDTNLPNASTNQLYSHTLNTAEGTGTPPFTWLLTGSLPAGCAQASLSITGVLSCTPTQAGTFTFTVSVRDSYSATTLRAYTVTWFAISSVSPNSGQQGASNLNVGITGQSTNWVQGTTTVDLGAGIAVNSVTVSSPTSLTANISIASNAVVGVRNLAVSTGLDTVNLANAFTVAASPPVMTSVNPIRSGTRGKPYSFTFTAAGGTPPYTFSQPTGATPPPAGLTLAATGVLSGTLSAAAGPYAFPVRVTGSFGGFSDTVVLMSVFNPVTITNTSPMPPGTVDRGYSQYIYAIGGDRDYLWSEVKPATGTDTSCPGPLTGLPSGLAINASGESDNVNVGYEPTVAGNFTFCVQADDNAGAVGRKQFQIVVNPPPTISTNLPNASTNQLYSHTLSTTGGTAPFSWSLPPVPGSLPPGCTPLSLSTEGVLSCTPTQAGTFNFTIDVQDANFATASRPYTVTWFGIGNVIPNSGRQGTANQNVVITGQSTNWAQGTTSVTLGAGITVNFVAVTSATTLTANITIAANAAVGARDLTITTGSEVVNLPSAFEVTGTAPAILSVNPNTGKQGTNNLDVVIAGEKTNWVQDTTTVNLGSGITVNSVTVSNQPVGAIFVNQVLSDNPKGFWILNDVAGSPTTARDSSTNAFNGTYETGVTPQGIASPPWVPSPGLVANFAGGTVSFPTPVNLGGNGYTIEAWVNPSVESLQQSTRFVSSGSGFNGYAFGADSGGRLFFTSFSRHDYHTTGLALLPNQWQYVGVVLDANNSANFYVNGSLVESLAGTLSTTAPTGNFTIGNTSPGLGHIDEIFTGGLTGISIYDTALTPAQIRAQYHAAVATDLTANISIAANASVGPRDLTVTTGSEIVNQPGAFTVTAGTHVISSVTPNIASQGTSGLTITIAGQFTNWVQGITTVSMGGGITVNSVTVGSPTSLTANISIPLNAALGAQNLIVTTGTEVVSLTSAFTVTVAVPAITIANPNTGRQGTNNLSLAIAGQFTHWAQGTTTVSLGAGVTVNSVTVTSTTGLIANISIAANAIVGTRNLTVTTGAELLTLTNGFTVTAGAPVITSVNPNSGQQAVTNLNVAIAGEFTNWVQGSTTVSLGAGITVNSVTVSAATSLTANISVASNTALGTRNLTVTTSAEVATLANAFRVTAGAPVITSVNPNAGQEGAINLSVAIAGQFTNWVQDSTTVNLGAGIVVNSVTVISATTLTANISIAPGAPAGPRTLTVMAGAEVATLANAFTVTAGTPVITTVNPNTGQQGTNNLNVAIAGQFTHWAQGTTTLNLGAGITVNSVTVSSAITLTANISVAPNASAVARTLTVTTGAEVVNLANAFTVTAGTPVITSINPNSAQQGTNNLSLAIAGQFTHWAQGTTTMNLGAGITVNSVTVSSATSLTANISLAATAAAGARNLTVTTGAEVVNLANAVTVTAATPVVTTVNPNSGQQGANNLSLAIAGQFTHWAQGTTTMNLGAGITVNSVTVNSATSLTANISLAATAAAGARNLTVTTGAEVVNLANAFTVTTAIPVLTTVNPNTGQQGTNNLSLAIAGQFTHWTQGTTTVNLGAGITVNSVTVSSATTLSANISIAATAAAGARSLTVTTGAEVATLANAFTVTAATPVITTVNPTSGQQGANTLNVAISGQFTHWAQGTTTVNLGAGITVNSVTVSSATALTANISIAPNATAGPRNLTVTTGAEVANLANAFTVTAATPLVTTVNPNTSPQGNSNLNVAIAGQFTNWAQGTTTVNLGAGITVNSVTVSSATALTANISIAPNATAGPRNLTVTTGAEVVNLASAFTVTAAAPIITTINPNSGQQGANNLNLAIAGQFTHWAQGTTAVNLGAGITVNTVTVSTPTSLTANVSIAANATVGPRSLTVTTGAEVANLANALTVTAAASVITTVNPNSGQQGANNLNVAIAGQSTNWAQGATTVNLGAGITVNSVTVSNTTNLTVKISIAANSTSGLRTLTVTTGNEVASLANAFTVTSTSVVITTTTLPGSALNAPYTAQLASTGGTPPYTWSLQSGSLPAGLSLSPTGLISGTPVALGPAQFEAKVTDSIGTAATRALTIAVRRPGLTITTDTIPNGTVGVSYSTSFAASGGDPPYTWSLQSSEAPGLVLSSSGELKGTPTRTGTFNLVVLVTDSARTAYGQLFKLMVVSPKLEISTTSLPNGIIGSPYSGSVAATGGLPPYSWGAVGLPPGLGMSTAGEITGTPTRAGTFPIAVTATDTEKTSLKKDLSIRIVGPLEISTESSIPPGTLGASYSFTLSASGGAAPYHWSGSAPVGLSVTLAGVITGTPSVAGKGVVEATVTDAENRTATKQLSIEIFVTLVIVTEALPRGTVGAPYATSVLAAGGRPPYRFAGSGPEGLSIDAQGIISGTPRAAGTFSFDLEVTDSANVATKRTYPITIVDPLTVTTSSLPDGTLGTPYTASLLASGGRPPYRWSVLAGKPPEGLSVSQDGTISGTPTAPGKSTLTATVTDAGNASASSQLSITITAPPVSRSSISGLPANPQPQTQVKLNIVLESPYPSDVTVTMTLTFASEVGGDDRTILFSTGGRTANLIIPAGKLQSPSAIGLQTGTVAGTITITTSMSAGGMDVTPQPQPTSTIVIPRGAPVLNSLQIQRTSTGLNLIAIGHTVNRSATQAVLTLEPAPGSNLQTTTLTVDVSAVFATYFGTAASDATGGQFSLVLPLTINGDQNAIRSISMTLVNGSGPSQPVSALVP